MFGAARRVQSGVRERGIAGGGSKRGCLEGFSLRVGGLALHHVEKLLSW